MNVLRLDRKFRQVHVWDGKTFSNHGYPVSKCGQNMYPRPPLRLVTHVELNQKDICITCNTRKRRTVAKKK